MDKIRASIGQPIQRSIFWRLASENRDRLTRTARSGGVSIWYREHHKPNQSG